MHCSEIYTDFLELPHRRNKIHGQRSLQHIKKQKIYEDQFSNSGHYLERDNYRAIPYNNFRPLEFDFD